MRFNPIFVLLLLDACLAVAPYNLMPTNFTFGCNFVMGKGLIPTDLRANLYSDDDCKNSVSNVTYPYEAFTVPTSPFRSLKLSRALNQNEYMNFMSQGVVSGAYWDSPGGIASQQVIGTFPWACAFRNASLSYDDSLASTLTSCAQIARLTDMPSNFSFTCSLVQHNTSCGNPVGIPELQNCSDPQANQSTCAKLDAFYPDSMNSSASTLGNISTSVPSNWTVMNSVKIRSFMDREVARDLKMHVHQ